jgi:phospholipid/cholesterol/gamma-HCH transport system substrate-binding protein
MSQETKLGLFVLVGLTFLVVSVLMLGDFQFQSRYFLNIAFSDASGLPNKAKVKIAGVDIGAVKDIQLADGKARVKVWIYKKVKIHSDAKARIVSTGIIGSKYLELTSGSESAPLLGDNDTLEGTTPLSFDKIVDEAMEKLSSITDAFGSLNGKQFGKNLAQTVENLNNITGTIREALYEKEEKLSKTIDNLYSFSNDLAEISQDNKENLRVAIAEFKDFIIRVDSITAKIENGQGTVGKLVSDNEMGENLKTTFNELKETAREANKTLKRINYIETKWDYTLRYDGKYEVYRHDIGLRIFPRPDKYYYLGMSNVGLVNPDIFDPQKDNTFDFHVGKIWGPANVYAGVLRSNGGLGIKFKPFWKWDPWRRLELKVEASNFSRTQPIRKPIVNLGANVEVTKWAYLGAQVEDTYSMSSINSYLNIVLKDEDLGYILGLVGLARP